MMADTSYRTGVTIFDDLFGTMHPGNIYLLVGRTGLNRHITDRLAVIGAQRGGRIYYIGGGYGADPFVMARILRMQRGGPMHVLERVMIARAFTAYQMDSLVRESLQDLPSPPELLIVSAMDSLFSDPEEAGGMLENCMSVLNENAGKGASVVISASGGSRESEVLSRISPCCSNWASFTNRFPSRVRIVTRGGDSGRTSPRFILSRPCSRTSTGAFAPRRRPDGEDMSDLPHAPRGRDPLLGDLPESPPKGGPGGLRQAHGQDQEACFGILQRGQIEPLRVNGHGGTGRAGA